MLKNTGWGGNPAHMRQRPRPSSADLHTGNFLKRTDYGKSKENGNCNKLWKPVGTVEKSGTHTGKTDRPVRI